MTGTSLRTSELSTRTRNTLLAEGITTFEQLATYSARELLSVLNFGKQALAEIIEALEVRGLSLKPPLPRPGKPKRFAVRCLQDPKAPTAEQALNLGLPWGVYEHTPKGEVLIARCANERLANALVSVARASKLPGAWTNTQKG